jgi:hypothetical protein
MSSTNKINLVAELNGLGLTEIIPGSFSTTTTITASQHGYVTQATADTAETLDMGGVTTAHLVIIHCVANDVDIDTSYSASFHAEITVNEGEWAVFHPTGTIYFQNNDAAEKSVLEYWIWGV